MNHDPEQSDLPEEPVSKSVTPEASAPTPSAPADEKPVEGSADEKPADEKPADEKPADEKPADEKPAEGSDGEASDGEAEDEAVDVEGLEEAEAAWVDEEDEDPNLDVEPLELNLEEEEDTESLDFNWYILKVQVNRETSIRDGLERRVKMHGMEPYFKEIVVPTEDVAEFTKAGKKRIVKKKLFPGYIMVQMAINDESWFLVRETSGIGDFTGAGGKPAPMDPAEVEKIIRKPDPEGEEGPQEVRSVIPFKPGDRVRVKDGNFQNFEGDVETIDETHGRVTVEIVLFGRPTPVELEHWQIEKV